MRNAFAGVFVAVLVATAGPVFAQTPQPVERPSTTAKVPNFLGATGLLYVPSAYVQDRNTVSAFFAGSGDFIGGGATGGILDRLEVGLGVADVNNHFGGNTEFLLNAKYQILKEKRTIPALSVGVVDALARLDSDPSWYVVASKYFTRSEVEQRFAVKGHVGFGGGIYGDDVLAGAELFFDRNLSAMAEFIDGDIDVGGRYTWRSWSATLGLFRLSHIGGSIAYTVRFR
jgi:hypothetical protein